MITLWFRPTPLRKPAKPNRCTMEAIIEVLCPMNLDNPDLLVFNVDLPPSCTDEEYQRLLQNASGQIARIIMSLSSSTCVVQGQFAQPLSPREITTINSKWTCHSI